jgi:hypothetical protein
VARVKSSFIFPILLRVVCSVTTLVIYPYVTGQLWSPTRAGDPAVLTLKRL